MFSFRRGWGLFAIALASASPNGASADEKESKEDGAVRAAVMSYFGAFEKLDSAALAACLGRTFSTAVYPSKAEFVERMKNSFTKIESRKYKIDVRSIQRGPQQQARVRVDFSERVKTKSGSNLEDEVRWAMYLEREREGWKLITIREAYVDAIVNAKKAANKADRVAVFRAEGDDFIVHEFLAKLYDEQAATIDKGDVVLAEKFQEFAETAVAAIEEKTERDLQEAIAFTGRARIAERQANYGEAIDATRKSLAAFRKRGARTFEVAALINLGALLCEQGDFKKAIEVLEEANALLSGLNEFAQFLNRTKLLGNLGVVYTELGEHGKALRYLEESIANARKAGDREAELNARLNLANIYLHRNQYAEAIRIYEDVQLEFAKAGLRSREGPVLNNIGNALAEQKRFADAIRKFETARQTCAAVKDRRGEAQALMNLGLTHYRLGSEADAERYTERGLKLHREIGDKAGICRVLMLVGLLHQEAGRHDQAVKLFRESLEMAKATGRKEDLAQGNLVLGISLEERGEAAEAVRAYEAASAFYGATRDPVRSALVRIKRACVRQKNGTWLLDLGELTELGRLAEQIDDPRVTNALLDVRALYHFETRDWKAAVADLRKAIALSEQSRQAVEDPILKAAYGDGQLSKRYTHLAWALAQQNDAPGVFGASESFKARSLMELLERSRTTVRKGLTDRETADEQRSRESVAAATRQFYSGQRLSLKTAERAVLKKEMTEAQARYDEFSRNLSLAHPELAGRQATFAPLDLKEVQRKVFEREPNLAILSYVVGKSNTLIIVITSGESPEGPARIAVHRAAVGAKQLRAAVDTFRESCSRVGFALPSSDDLWKWLIAPAAKELAGKNRLVIVPSSPLLSLPFQALKDGDKPYLLEQYAISYAPAVTALAEMLELGERHRRLAKQRQEVQGIPLLAVGRPAFTKELKDLPFSEPEAKAVAACYGEGSRLLVGANATRKQIRALLERAVVVHFATHGIINEARPMFSALALTPEDKNDDGRLYAHDILNLDLKADLVVLSACETGLGREYAGEGMLGLAWAFFVAGSPSAIISQWSVADESSSRLMQTFYKRLTAQPAPAKADALREAQLGLLKDAATRHPFYWAPFVLVGDWR